MVLFGFSGKELTLEYIVHLYGEVSILILFTISWAALSWRRNYCAANIIPLGGLAGSICEVFRGLSAQLTDLFQQNVGTGEAQDELSFE